MEFVQHLPNLAKLVAVSSFVATFELFYAEVVHSCKTAATHSACMF